MEESRQAGQKEEKPARRMLDQAEGKERGRAADEERKNLTGGVEKKDAQLKNDDAARKSEPEARPDPAREKAAAPAPKAPDAKPFSVEAPAAAGPGAAPPKPAAPSPTPAPVAKPAEAPADKFQDLKKNGEGLAKQEGDAKAKRAGEPPADTHLTIASTQLAKARPAMEETLRKMGVRIPGTPPAMTKGQPSKGLREESTLSVELTDSQISRLRQELEKLGHSRLVVGNPADPTVLAQFGDSGLYRAKKEVASGGAAAPARKATDAPKPETAKAESKEKDKDGKDAEDLPAKTLASAAPEEPKRKVVLHLLEVAVMPDPQPAGDALKK
jgi:hypothetical protein